MKKLFCIISLLSVTSAFASVDLSQFSKLEGRSGVGTNPYEDNSLSCYIKIDAENNTLSIEQPDASYSNAIVFGNEVVKQTNSDGVIILTTKESNPFKSGLCGDWLKARSVKNILKVNPNSVQISLSYRCGLVSHEDVTTCKLKK
jgi:hypothetical protein